jgi:hypothetical protein
VGILEKLTEWVQEALGIRLRSDLTGILDRALSQALLCLYNARSVARALSNHLHDRPHQGPWSGGHMSLQRVPDRVVVILFVLSVLTMLPAVVVLLFG